MLTRHSESGSKKPRNVSRSFSLALWLALVVALALGSAACQSGPVRAFRGAQHYAAGSEALERGDSDRAVSELERAAELVPHASEIQNHLGLAYLSKGERDRAQAAFRTAIALDCDNEAAQSNLERSLRDGQDSSPSPAGTPTQVNSAGRVSKERAGEPVEASTAAPQDRRKSHGG